MKQIFILIAILAACGTARAQVLGLGKKLTEYRASNGVTYHVGDTIKLGKGSAPDGTFRYLQYGGWGMFLINNGKGADSRNVEKTYSGYGAVVKKIHSFKAHGTEKVLFAVGIGGVTNYDLSIEDAIATCEVEQCASNKASAVNTSAPDRFDQLKKLKALLEAGVLTQAEYDAQKKKLLNQ